IETVKRCILATRLQAEPADILEKIIKDADTSHLGKDYFEETSELLRKELHLQNISDFSDDQWLKENIRLFTEKHRYYTLYAIENWQDKKDENLLQLMEKREEKKTKYKKEETKAKLKAKFKDESPERGIQTLFRVTMRNHLKLSDIADTKANILLSVNAIIVSLAIANIIPQIIGPTGGNLMIPTLILLLFSVASIVGAILSTRPNVTSGEFTKEQVKKKEVNVLFFGNFHKMPYDQFEWAMNETIKDQDFVYSSLMKDLYMLGVVLNRKYMLLRITYTIFMIGIILSVLAFILTFYLPNLIPQ
ncbi:MAG TPA: Pycsar system effector family protein, partial [Salinimicrobium sp.]|nr:Pycsar system effector family protein [Salinimicrobium sp.]